MNSEELKRQADAVLGDEQKELLKELLLSEKVTRNTAVENTKELQNALSSLEKSLSSETTKLSDLLDDLKVLVNDGKVNLPELYKVYVENQQTFPDSVAVSNLKDIEFPKAEKFPEEVGLRESSWLSVHFKGLLGAVLSLKKDVQAVKIEGGGDAKRPIAVRLSDGKKFIDTLVTAVSSATRQTFPFVTSTGEGQDMGVYYDGTNGNIDTDLVAASDLTVDCGTAKTLVLEVPVYQDCNVGALILKTGGTLPGTVQILDNDGDNTGIYTLGFADGEQGSGVFEIPHDYKEGTDVVFHVHWGSNDAPTGTDQVEWRLIYTIQRDDTTFVDATTVDSGDVAYDTQYEWLRTDVATITGTNIKIGDQFFFTLMRITAAGDAFAGEALVASLGIHYQVDTLGSRLIGTK